MHRLSRQMRYRWLYPMGAVFMFPPQTHAELVLLPSGVRLSSQKQTLSYERLHQEAEDLCHHRFAFLNLPPEDLGDPVNWCSTSGHDPLWLYNLHYGEWARALSSAYLITKEARFLEALMQLINDWIEHNPVCKGPGWEPYPLSRRIVAWSRIGLSLQDDGNWQVFWKDRLAPSLHLQTRVLAVNLEKDLSNNHLIANYRALAWVGLLFPGWPGADKWRSAGCDGLWSEMRRQVLQDGVHDERSMSYHTIVIQDLLEIWYLCQEVGQPVPEDVEPTLKKMMQFLADMTAPDGSYPMLNDTVPGYPMNPGSILLAGGLLFHRADWISPGSKADSSYAVSLTGASAHMIEEKRGGSSQKPVVAYPDSGYVILRDENGGCLYFDAGAMGPEHLPGHGHADALSFVLCGGGRPLIVDPGVYSYHNSAWRNYFRSTAAHNTITIDGQDQCVFWGNFRVAYAPKACLTGWSSNFVSGEHEGYRRLKNPVFHSRRVDMKGNGKWEVSDSLDGKGEHDFSFTLQFSPNASVKMAGNDTVVIWPDGARLTVTPSSIPTAGKVFIEEGWVSYGWNIKEKAPRYVLKWRSGLPVRTHLILTVINN